MSKTVFSFSPSILCTTKTFSFYISYIIHKNRTREMENPRENPFLEKQKKEKHTQQKGMKEEGKQKKTHPKEFRCRGGGR